MDVRVLLISMWLFTRKKLDQLAVLEWFEEVGYSTGTIWICPLSYEVMV